MDKYCNAIKLNIGSGKRPLDGYVNVDKLDLEEVDVKHDLNSYPWPFKDNSCSEILLDTVLEHLPDTVKVLEEIHRIAQPRALIKIHVPYFASYNAFADPTHISFFTYKTFDYFTDNFDYNYYTSARFKIIKRKIYVTHATYGLILKPLEWLINRLPRVYEKFFCYILPSNSLSVELEVIK
jgi:SAM-dependent methyltransferase